MNWILFLAGALIGGATSGAEGWWWRLGLAYAGAFLMVYGWDR